MRELALAAMTSRTFLTRLARRRRTWIIILTIAFFLCRSRLNFLCLPFLLRTYQLSKGRSLSLSRNEHTVSRAAAGGSSHDVASWSTKELQRFLSERAVRHDDCFDKEELIQRARSAQDLAAGAAASSQRQDPSPPPPQNTRSFTGFGETVTVPSSMDQSEQASFIFFHGFGDSARGFAGQLPNLLQLPWMHYVLPTAKSMGGMRSWFTSMGTGGGDPGDSVAYAHHLIRSELSRGVPSSKLFIGGFSQGGSVAVQAATSFPDSRLGGCVAASTFLSGRLAPAAANRQLPVLVCHGEADSAVPLSSGQALASALRAASIPTEFRSYPGMNHATSPEEIADVRKFLHTRSVVAGGWPSLRSMRVRELKALLTEAQISTVGCIEKEDLLERAGALFS